MTALRGHIFTYQASISKGAGIFSASINLFERTCIRTWRWADGTTESSSEIEASTFERFVEILHEDLERNVDSCGWSDFITIDITDFESDIKDMRRLDTRPAF